MRLQIQEFLDHAATERGFSANTVAAYRNDLTQFAAFLDGRVPDWQRVGRDAIVEYILHCKVDQEYASSTVARKVAAIKSFFHYLAAQRHIADDPTITLDSPKVRKRPPKAIPAGELDRLLGVPADQETPRTLRDRVLLELLYSAGLRVTELIALDVDDVQLESGTLRVVRSKDGRERAIAIRPRTAGPLREYLDHGRRPHGKHPGETALFLNHRGQRLTRQGLWLIVKRYVREAGIGEDITPQMLRHSLAAQLLDSDSTALQPERTGESQDGIH